MIDFHTHTFLSDGALLPTELVRRARVAGYEAMAITDHVDESNLEPVVEQITRACKKLNQDRSFTVVPGVELTHIPPADVPELVARARDLGAKVVIGHGETLVEPVVNGTNRAYIEAGVDILAHPGLIMDLECELAAEKGVHLEITSRKGHSLTNGHVASMALKHGARLLVNTDSHTPGDLINADFARKVALGAGLSKEDFDEIRKNARELLRRVAS